MRQVKLRIEGKVQGVFFRHSVKQLADKLSVKGYIKNNFDGSVKVVAVGKDERVEELVNFCRQGPIGAEVKKVEVKEEKPAHEFKGFQIKI